MRWYPISRSFENTYGRGIAMKCKKRGIYTINSLWSLRTHWTRMCTLGGCSGSLLSVFTNKEDCLYNLCNRSTAYFTNGTSTIPQHDNYFCLITFVQQLFRISVCLSVCMSVSVYPSLYLYLSLYVFVNLYLYLYTIYPL